MLEFIASLPTIDDEAVTKSLWSKIHVALIEENGVGYYKHPLLGPQAGPTADLTVLTKSIQPMAIKCLPYDIDELLSVSNDAWIVKDDITIESPLLQLDDFVFALAGLINQDRRLRRRLRPRALLALPRIAKTEFDNKFGPLKTDVFVHWNGSDIRDAFTNLERVLTDEEWKLFRAAVQGATPLMDRRTQSTSDIPQTLSYAIRELELQITDLDSAQERVAIQIPPGPQRIRGLAGTGKTVLLAMRAANIHRHYPERKILFTFNTQSLYNQTQQLIRRFYGVHTGNREPDWNMIHVRHAWGGRNKPGVYSDLCSRKGVVPLNLASARAYGYGNPFQACCEHALNMHVEPAYDYVIVDEAQDFPSEFFQLLYRLSRNPHCIYWAYDQLQSLAESSLAIPGPEDLFGYDETGKPYVTFGGEDYAGQIQKDFVLDKSYRCPLQVLMLAHAIGLGLYNRDGCVQMLELKESWTALGYEVEDNSDWREGFNVNIYRPARNSPNPVDKIYRGRQELITVQDFQNRSDEFDWVANSIKSDIERERVAEKQIIVVVLDARKNRKYASAIQKRLVKRNVASVIPGVLDHPDSYAEEGRVTISSVFRAKGNEAYIVYIVGFDDLYSWVDFVPNRNRAFTAISRSKAWVRISGTGSTMQRAKKEINAILEDIPKFRFPFPNMENLRNLDAVTERRRRKRITSDKHLSELIRDPELLDSASPNLILELRERLSEYDRGH